MNFPKPIHSVSRMGWLALYLFCMAVKPMCNAQSQRNLLTNIYTRKTVVESIPVNTDWVDYPAYSDRGGWDRLSNARKVQLVKKGEKYLDFSWSVTTATQYLAYSRTGNRTIADNANKSKLTALRALALAELVEGKGRFLDDIINGTFAFCEQTYWGSPAHLYIHGYEGTIASPTTILPDNTNPIIDLVAGDVAADLAWVWYFFHEAFDKVSPIISQRLISELRIKILEPFYHRNDYWWITGWGEGRVNNWTPWCSYNMLTCILLLETDKRKREDAIYKTMQSVDLFINTYPEDGGCSEGPGYWAVAGGKLFDYLTLLKKSSKGRISVFNNDLIQNMGKYIYKIYVSQGENYVNFADAPAKIQHDGGRIYRFGKTINDSTMQGFGAYLLDKNKGELPGDRLGERLENLFNLDITPVTRKAEPLLKEHYLRNLDVAIARDKEGTNQGFYFAAKGGHNGEQHNHNDVGSFILSYNGTPVLIDVGVGTYTRETFSKERYSIWTMQSNYHNVPLINGLAQQQGRNFKARNSTFAATKHGVRFTTDISGAYPKEAAVKSWQRAYHLERNKKFTISDIYELTANTSPTRLHFLTTLPSEQHMVGGLVLKGNDFDLLLRYDPKTMSATVEKKVIDDPRLERAIGNVVYRIVLEMQTGKLSGSSAIEVIRYDK